MSSASGMKCILALTAILVAVGGCPMQSTTDGPDDTTVFATFTDPDSDFSTSDVYDVQDEIVRFDTEAKSIIWAADGRAFQAGSWTIDGNLLGSAGAFQVRFGNVDGARRAYFTETGPATICDIRVENDTLRIFPTSVVVPQ